MNVVNPLDPSEIIPIYNLNVAKRGQVAQVDKNSDINKRTYNGFDVGFTARVGGGNVYGGTSIGRQVTVFCEVQDPNSLRYCDQRDLGIPYLAQFKLAGMYPLMYGVQVSGSWQGYPGVPTGTGRQDVEYVTRSQPGSRSVAQRELHRDGLDADQHHGSAAQAGHQVSRSVEPDRHAVLQEDRGSRACARPCSSISSTC